MSADAATAPAADAAAGEEAKAPKAPGVMMPLLAVIILMPGIAYGLTEFVLIPKLKAALPQVAAAEGESKGSAEGHAAAAEGGEKKKAAPAAEKKEAAAPKKAAEKKEGKEAKGGGEGAAEPGFEFKDVIVNLSGAMGTRYLKTSFTATGSDPRTAEALKDNKQKLLDLTLSILSSRTVNDLESPAAKNAVRAELIAKFNQILGAEMVEEIYFSEFVIQ